MKYSLRYKAIIDLSEIWNFTVLNWSEKQADTYYNLIKVTCLKISENPTLGKKYDKINRQLLGYKVGEHIIFYQVVSRDEIEIIRILHGRMDLKNKIIE